MTVCRGLGSVNSARRKSGANCQARPPQDGNDSFKRGLAADDRAGTMNAWPRTTTQPAFVSRESWSDTVSRVEPIREAMSRWVQR